MIEFDSFKNEPIIEKIHISLQEANQHLSSRAFVLWIMIHTFKSNDLLSGRKHISELICWPKSTTDCYLRELVLKGFILLAPQLVPWECSQFFLVKVCKLDSKSKFVKLVI